MLLDIFKFNENQIHLYFTFSEIRQIHSRMTDYLAGLSYRDL